MHAGCVWTMHAARSGSESWRKAGGGTVCVEGGGGGSGAGRQGMRAGHVRACGHVQASKPQARSTTTTTTTTLLQPGAALALTHTTALASLRDGPGSQEGAQYNVTPPCAVCFTWHLDPLQPIPCTARPLTQAPALLAAQGTEGTADRVLTCRGPGPAPAAP